MGLRFLEVQQQNTQIEVKETVVAVHGFSLPEFSFCQIQQLSPIFLHIVLLNVTDSLVEIRLDSVAQVVFGLLEFLSCLWEFLACSQNDALTKFEVVGGATGGIDLLLVLPQS